MASASLACNMPLVLWDAQSECLHAHVSLIRPLSPMFRDQNIQASATTTYGCIQRVLRAVTVDTVFRGSRWGRPLKIRLPALLFSSGRSNFAGIRPDRDVKRRILCTSVKMLRGGNVARPGHFSKYHRTRIVICVCILMK